MTIAESGLDALAPVTGLIVELDNGVLSVTIDRPESLNSLTPKVLDGLADALECAATDPRVRVVRLAGNGRGFSSGAGIGAVFLGGAGRRDQRDSDHDRHRTGGRREVLSGHCSRSPVWFDVAGANISEGEMDPFGTE